MDIISQLIAFLESVSNDPVSYSVIFYIYSVLAAIILPIPIEFGLFLNQDMSIFIKALILGLGKATGAYLIFYLGIKVEGPIMRWSSRWKWVKRFMDAMERFVLKTRYIGLFILMSIPFMLDTLPNYLFSIFNKDGKALNAKWFTLTNLFAGITRALVIYAIFLLFDLKFF
jgi:hypothetical protein